MIIEEKCARSPLTRLTDYIFELLKIKRYIIMSTKTVGRVTAFTYSSPMLSERNAKYIALKVDLMYPMGWKSEIIEYDRKKHSRIN